MKQKLQQFLMGSSLPNDKLLNSGWLLFRLHIGLSMAIHAGWPKMNTLAAPGWFNDQVAGLGFTFPSPAFWATLASWGEFAGGFCIALGFLTRFNAFQLAFQFFVISFLWYDKPEPLTGMYFQQTLFFAYVITVFAGSGRFSIDHLLLHRKKRIQPVAIRTAIAVVLLFTGLIGFAKDKPQSAPASAGHATIRQDETTFCKVRISNKTGQPLELFVVYPVNGRFGISIRSGRKTTRKFPVGTRLYKTRPLSTDEPAFYTVTAASGQKCIIQ